MEIHTLFDAERYLDGFINRERVADFDYEKLGLARIRGLLAAIGHPEAGLPCVHITGSKGKGSVALSAEALLRAAGRRVGTYTSPHLETWRERFRIDGEMVSVEGLLTSLRRIQPVVDRVREDPETRPSFFDVTTALAFEIFRDAGIDAGVIEVGIGGRLDSTNVVDSRVCVLTAVQLEHTDKLGDSVEKIALEKAGIFRKEIPVVHGPLPAEAWGALLARSVAEDAPLEEVEACAVEATAAGQRFELPDGRRVETGVLGAHQATNLAIAVRACEHFLGRELDAGELRSLARLRLPARVECMGPLVLDSAHTPDSARALRETLEGRWPGRRWVLGLAISRDKDAAGILRELAGPTRSCVLTRAEPLRSADTDELRALAEALGVRDVVVCPDPLAALDRVRELRDADELGVLTGSIYFAGAIRGKLLEGARSR
jgi:dihydrofolate synthase/folylpolyglutamate synthase